MKIDNLASAIGSALADYASEVSDDVKDVVTQVANDTVSDLIETSPRKRGDYAKGWRRRTAFENATERREVVYNKVYQLTHLLEYGHAKVGGGFVPGQPHIKPAEDKAMQKLIKGITAKLK